MSEDKVLISEESSSQPIQPIQPTQPVDIPKDEHTSRCLACKQNYTYKIDYKGEIETSNKAKRFMIHGVCPKGHKIRTFVKKPQEKKQEKS